MSGVLRRHPFPLKYMAQMPATVGAKDFRALHAEGVVAVPDHRPRYFVIKGRPPATAVEFVRRTV